MGMRPVDRWNARLNFLPCLSLWLNSLGIPFAAWATFKLWREGLWLPAWVDLLCAVNLGLFAMSLVALYVRTWRRSALVLKTRRARALYLLRVNPLFLMVWWLVWLIPLWIGFRMYLRDEGLVWERTVKNDANHGLVRGQPKMAEVIKMWPKERTPALEATVTGASRQQAKGVSNG
jgi:hypothetical protein